MAKNIRRKRPCCICRKWFQPIAQQRERQRTCGPACRKELHRRQCEQWNRKNKAYFKNNYLAEKLQTLDEKEQKEKSMRQPGSELARLNHSPSFLPRSTLAEPILPMDIIIARVGKKNAVIIEYLIFQVTRHGCSRTFGIP